MYPAIVVSMMVVIMGIMLLFVMPKLSALYVNLNVPLPLPTQILIGLSGAAGTFWPILLVLFVVGGYAFRKWKSSPNGELIFDTYVLKVPVFGILIKKTILAEFSRTLGLLVGTGTLVVDALLQTGDVAGNKLFENAIRDVSKRVEKGVTVGDALSAYPVFPQILVQLVKVGEQTGKLDETLIKASEYFETEVDQSVKTLTTAMEPFIMVVLGVGVAFLIISVITPIYSLVSAIQ
jgi:type II secretory pathway component PulF